MIKLINIFWNCNKADEKRIEELAQREEQMKQQYNEKIRSYKERYGDDWRWGKKKKWIYSDKIYIYLFNYSEHDLQRQLNQALDQLTQLRHTHDDTQAQLLNHNQKYGNVII